MTQNIMAALKRIPERIAVFRDKEPEEDETWESWYFASFDLLKAEVEQISLAAIAEAESAQGLAADMLAALKEIRRARGNCGASPFEQNACNMVDAAIAKAEGDGGADLASAPADHDLDPLGFIKKHGWKTVYLDDGCGPTGWFAYKGDYMEPDIETGIFDTEQEAAREAIASYPTEFGLEGRTDAQ